MSYSVTVTGHDIYELRNNLRDMLRMLQQQEEQSFNHQYTSIESVPEKILQTNIDELEFSVRAYGRLKAAGISNIRELLEYGYDKLSHVKGMGRKSNVEVLEMMHTFGLKHFYGPGKHYNYIELGAE